MLDKMSIGKIKERLLEFNAEAQELFELPFIQKMQHSGLKISASKGSPLKIEKWGPDANDTKAICNDLRKFIQPNDTLNAEKLRKIYDSEEITLDEQKNYESIMAELDRFNKSPANFIKDGTALTNQQIFEIFLYGKISHRTEGKKQIHDDWAKNPVWHASIQNEFLLIIAAHMAFVNNLVVLNKTVLKRLEGLVVKNEH
ncbi:hypothetical protein J4219_00930 [Candidatus Woesearchaeota archaeon]|nr:hypothetical protein [Candidatus Woesearchaeota archaeon]